MTALRAFETAARHRNFSQAAAELHTTQSSVSRVIADLERELSVRLFERNRQGAYLTEAGETLYRGTAAALAALNSSVAALRDPSNAGRIVIACSPAASHLFLMPRFEALRRALGGSTCLRILTCDYDMLGRLDESEADLVISYSTADGAPGDRREVIRPAMGPVCSPDFAAAHAGILRRPVREWGAMPFLDYARPSRGWATWRDWFEAVGHPEPPPAYVDYQDYVYLINAATAGRGLALAWDGFIERFIDAGTLVAAAGGFIEFDCPLYVRLTERGRSNPAARQGFEVLPALRDIAP